MNNNVQNVFDQIVSQTKNERTLGGAAAGTKMAMDIMASGGQLHTPPPQPPTQQMPLDPLPPPQPQKTNTKRQTTKKGAATKTENPLDISATEIKKISDSNHDYSIDQHIVAINEEIRDCAENGGYSVNLPFKVHPQDTKLVQNLVDWYRTKGFDVEVGEPTAPQLGQNVGMLIFDIHLSWVNA